MFWNSFKHRSCKGNLRFFPVHIILDLSHPKNASVNDGINRSMCSLTYMKVEEVVQQILSMGNGCLLAKLDIKSAFRNVPVHPHDRHLLGMKWEDQLYIDTVLPFGLRSAPKIFNCIADALQWIARARGVSYLDHFLDDFITLGQQNAAAAQRNMCHLEHPSCSGEAGRSIHMLDIPGH